MNALVYVRHRPGHSLGKKSDEHLQCSPQSWLDNFMQPFSWCSSLVQALDFQNKLFFPGVSMYNFFGHLPDFLFISNIQKFWKTPIFYSLAQLNSCLPVSCCEFWINRCEQKEGSRPENIFSDQTLAANKKNSDRLRWQAVRNWYGFFSLMMKMHSPPSFSQKKSQRKNI